MMEMDLFDFLQEEVINLKLNYMNCLSDFEASKINIMNEYLGCRVSLDCGDMGFYQGVISRCPGIVCQTFEHSIKRKVFAGSAWRIRM